MPEYQNTTLQLKERLWELAKQIRHLDYSADQVLQEKYDLQKHKEILKRKATLLSSLPEQVQPYLSNIENHVWERVMEQLNNFANNAQQALKVESVFFMRQLLYPEDYQEGQDNDLERFIRSL